MRTSHQSYIGGPWFDPADARSIDVIDRAMGRPYAPLRIGSPADVDRAVRAKFASEYLETKGTTGYTQGDAQ
nr:hypothetical protein [Paraburkholderia mimosarum]